MPFAGRGILLDIEGTTSAIAYVYDVMFPYARTGLDGYLESHWGEAPLAEASEQIAQDAGHESLAAWSQTGDAQQRVRDEAIRLMDADIKATGLKQLQGLIWEAGFKSGELRAHVFPDVPPALRAWQVAGMDLRIYSSGSVHAQQLFFGHVDLDDESSKDGKSGSLLPYFSGHYDTTTGPKREAASYKKIADDWQLPAADVLFLSDVVAEVDAAREAGMATSLVLRDGNAPVEDVNGHATIRSFDELTITALA
ncbi:MAG: acireductone synthase [Planctomycetota bacterium]